MAKPSYAQMKAVQGYLASNHRPACSNCHFRFDDAGMTEVRCQEAGFPVALGGWCPQWTPSKFWEQRHPDVVAIMPQFAVGFVKQVNAINDGEEEAPCTPA